MNWRQVEDLEPKTDHFIDITKHPVPKKSKVGVDPIPTKVTHQEIVNALIADLEADNLKATVEQLGTFFTRYYNSETGKDASQWIYNQFLALSANRKDITVEYFTHSWQMPSVIARIEGSSTGDKHATRIIIGGHADSIGSSSRGRSPGADDDASGVSTVMEVFRVAAQSGFKPERTVEFHAYSGEEGGLLGSLDIAALYQEMDIDVEGMLQLDMTAWGKNETQALGIITDYVNPDLTQFIRVLVDAYASFPHVNTKCGYGCSDHASWTRYGYRSAFPFETTFSTSNPYIHTSTDLVTHLNFARAIEFAKISVGFLVEMAGGVLSK